MSCGLGLIHPSLGTRTRDGEAVTRDDSPSSLKDQREAPLPLLPVLGEVRSGQGDGDLQCTAPLLGLDWIFSISVPLSANSHPSPIPRIWEEMLMVMGG